MTALPVAYYLKELSGETSRRGSRPFGGFGANDGSDLDVQLGDAHARGVQDGRIAAQAEHEAAIATQAAAFEQKLASERQRWVAEQGTRLADALVAALADFEARVAGQVGEILKPFLKEQIRSLAVAELSRSLDEMLARGDAAKITISGPSDLLAAMEARLGVERTVSFVVAETCEVTVSVDETILATQIGAWGDIIEGSSP